MKDREEFERIGAIEAQQQQTEWQAQTGNPHFRPQAIQGEIDNTERIERLEAQLEKLEQDRSAKMVERVARLEAIILSMAAGSESSPSNVGRLHTHWTYPLNKAQGLVGEIKDSLSPAKQEADARLCVKCHNTIIAEDDGRGYRNLCIECESDLVEEQEALGQLHDNDPVAELQAELDDPHFERY